MIVFIRSKDFNPDPRFFKYTYALSKNNIKYLIIGWDRDGCGFKNKGAYYFNKRAKYGSKYKNLFNKIIWMLYVIKTLFSIRNKIKIIHAADFESALPAMIFSKLCRKKLIFDVCDWIGNSSKTDPLLVKIIEKLENIIAYNADAIILCEQERLNQISEKNLKRVLIMPNIPQLDEEKKHTVFIHQGSRKNVNYELVLSYVGIFDYNRGIENLIELIVNNRDILLLIAGYGGLENLIIEASENNDNIIYFGKVDHDRALDLISVSDLLYACYHRTNPVHKYAAPNKFYESLICSTPIITTKSTLVGNKVDKYNTGYAIGESYKDLQNLTRSDYLRNSIKTKQSNCKDVWIRNFKDYIPKFMKNEYIPLLEELGKEGLN